MKLSKLVSILSKLVSILSKPIADAGRVYSGNDTRTGFGGGAFVNILDQAVLNVTYTVGEERLALVGFDFLF